MCLPMHFGAAQRNVSHNAHKKFVIISRRRAVWEGKKDRAQAGGEQCVPLNKGADLSISVYMCVCVSFSLSLS